MKAKIERGSGFRGALDYVLDEGQKRTGDKDPEVVGGTVDGRNAREMAKQFGLTRTLRPDVERPVWHCSLAIPKGEAPLSSMQWDSIVRDFLKKMGFPDDTVYVAVRHRDMDHDHVHIVASRISLSGKVWLGQNEVFKAIEATQQLEKEHDLTLTPGLGNANDESAPKAKLTTQEISKAERTGIKPPKLVIVDAITNALKAGKQSLTDFVNRLKGDGVDVVPKVASQTGDIQGMSFENQGLVFSGSKIATGGGYSWGRLQKKGVMYEQARDGQTVAELARAATERAESREASRVAGVINDSDAERITSIAASSGERNVGAVSLGRDARPLDAGAASSNLGDSQESSQRSGRDAEPANRMDSSNNGRNNEHAERVKESSSGNRESEGFAAGDQEVSAIGEGSIMENSNTVRLRVGIAGSAGTAWNSRFKRASAAKKRTATEPKSGRLDSNQVGSVKTIDPTAYLENAGFVVVQEGRHLSVQMPSGDEAYRITKKPDGVYVACDRLGNGIGDNIALVRELEPSVSFTDAVFKLSGGIPAVNAVSNVRVVAVAQKPPRLPVQKEESQQVGRKYLQSRGISEDSILKAESCGMVSYSKDSVFFVGYDSNGKVRSVTRRATNPTDSVQKRDLKGTDKAYPPVIKGSRQVVIVEGGVDALAVLERAKRQGKEHPTVIVSGGSNVRGFIQNEHIQSVLKNADSVTIAGEREKDAATQAKVDAARAKQVAGIQALGVKVSVFMPPEGVKDIAELNTKEAGQKPSEPIQSDKEAQERRNAYQRAKDGDEATTVQQQPRQTMQQSQPQAHTYARPKA